MKTRKCPICKNKISLKWFLSTNTSKKYECPKCKTILKFRFNKLYFFIFQVLLCFILTYLVFYLRWPTENILFDAIICLSLSIISYIIFFYFSTPVEAEDTNENTGDVGNKNKGDVL